MADKKVEFLYLSQEDVIACGGLNSATSIECVEKATLMFYKQHAKEAMLVHLLWNGVEGKRIGVHAGYLGEDLEISGVKGIPSNPENPIKRGTPRASALLMLNDAETGYPFALMEGSLISHVRTGAMTGVGAKYLAQQEKPIVGLIGAGPISRAQLKALAAALRELSEVRLFDIDNSRADLFKRDMDRELGLNICIMKSAEELVRGSDIVVPSTNVGKSESYIQYDWLKPGCMLSDVSMWDHTDEVILKADKIVTNNDLLFEFPHDRIAPLLAKDLISKPDVLNLGAVMTGDAKGRERDDEIILFCPRGMIIYDMCVGYEVYRTAKKKGLGTTLPLWKEPVWI